VSSEGEVQVWDGMRSMAIRDLETARTGLIPLQTKVNQDTAASEKERNKYPGKSSADIMALSDGIKKLTGGKHGHAGDPGVQGEDRHSLKPMIRAKMSDRKRSLEALLELWKADFGKGAEFKSQNVQICTAAIYDKIMACFLVEGISPEEAEDKVESKTSLTKEGAKGLLLRREQRRKQREAEKGTGSANVAEIEGDANKP